MGEIHTIPYLLCMISIMQCKRHQKRLNTLTRLKVSVVKDVYNSLPGQMKNLVKMFGRLEGLIAKTIACAESRLRRQYGKVAYPKGFTNVQRKRFEDFIRYGNVKDVEVKYVEDCFEELERPKFGWS